MYNYDAYSRLNSTVLKTDYTSRSTTYSYANVGGTGYSTRVEEVMDNGVSTWYNYDSNGNITQILENDETTYEYQYDEHNQLIKEDNKILNKTIEYTYDSSWWDFLTSYDGKVVTTDVIGNLLTYDGNTAVPNNVINFNGIKWNSLNQHLVLSPIGWKENKCIT